MHEKLTSKYDELNKDDVSVSNTRRKHSSLENDLQTLGTAVQSLQSELDNYRKVSKNKADIIVNECKSTLEKSRDKILEYDVKNKELQKRLQKINGEFLNDKEETSPKFQARSFKSSRQIPAKSSSSLENEKFDFSAYSKGVSSDLKDLHLSFILLSKIISKELSILKNMQCCQSFQQIVNLPIISDSPKFVSETDTIQLKNYVKQATRLSYDIKSIWKALNKTILFKATKSAPNLRRTFGIAISDSEYKNLENLISELSVNTAETYLVILSMVRSSFFDFLCGSKVLFEKYGFKETLNSSKHSSDCKRLENFLESAINLISKATLVTEKLVKQYADESLEFPRPETESVTKNKQTTSGADITHAKTLSGRSGTFDHILTDEHLSKRISDTDEKKQSKEELPFEISRKAYSSVFDDKYPKSGDRYSSEDLKMKSVQTEEIFDANSVIRNIDKTVSKIKEIENGDYLKDQVLCKHIELKLKDLSKKLEELHEEYNMKHIQDQFSEYSSLALSKLETLAKQSRNSVIAAEVQISAHRSNAKFLSEKLQETEELLRESINECLSLKQKLRQEEVQRETDKANWFADLSRKLDKVSDFDDLEAAVKEMLTTVDANKDKVKSVSTYECKYCTQGLGHKLCEEKLKDLRANNRKLTTELKLMEQELKEIRNISKLSRQQAESATSTLGKERENLKETLQSLESRNASLTEQLKLEKKRLKNLERFRRLEISGFQTDIKNLKSRIEDMEKQLMKAVLIFEHDKKDLELLKAVHETAQHSQQTAGALKRLKAKLYELETDIKNL
ncbi:uncharacterized protein PFB0765w-like isoform X2 [Stegodyphus dumicola]|uniref:uncharacterized protein PFB0765w-like isoform X2 n=1 Tax=Stegodyphus dumicola TaxID=202533 RepID=UPI0015AEBE1D|nr:uncharacterized protein PFB0765w-like isoform X2 [Stegodyphus dumicola]